MQGNYQRVNGDWHVFFNWGNLYVYFLTIHMYCYITTTKQSHVLLGRKVKWMNVLPVLKREQT